MNPKRYYCESDTHIPLGLNLNGPDTLLERIKATEKHLAELKEKLRQEIRVDRIRAKALKKLTAEEKQVLGL